MKMGALRSIVIPTESWVLNAREKDDVLCEVSEKATRVRAVA